MDQNYIPTGWTRGGRLKIQVISKPFDYPKHLSWTCALVWLECVVYCDPKTAPEPSSIDIACIRIQSDELDSVNKWLDWWFAEHPENDFYNSYRQKQRFAIYK